MSEETNYKVLNILEHNSTISQRELAKELGASLGKTNYCLKALLQKGLIKANNFKNSNHKSAYFYYLTPKGIEKKSLLTVKFLHRKRLEYEALRQEIEALVKEAERNR